MDKDKDRQAFETFVTKKFFDTTMDRHGYTCWTTQMAWEIWQDTRAAAAQPRPMVADSAGEAEPTEAMIDAARPLFLALEGGDTSIEDVRTDFVLSGHDVSYLPEWFRTGTGHLTKAGRAIIAWHMMQHAAPAPGASPAALTDARIEGIWMTLDRSGSSMFEQRGWEKEMRRRFARALLAQPAAPTAEAINTATIDRLTREKTAHIMARDGFWVTGFVLSRLPDDVCIVDHSAVRWMDGDALFRVMHPDAAQPPAAAEAEKWERWQIRAAEWLRNKATEQAHTNEKYPRHAACYPLWTQKITLLKMLATELDLAAVERAGTAPKGEKA